MKIYKMEFLLILLVTLAACSPDEFDYPNNDVIDPNDITGVTISPDHNMILADGQSEIDLTGGLYKFLDSTRVLNSRIVEEMIKYELVGEGEVDRFFKTESRVGETLKFFTRFENLVSDTVEIQVRAPLSQNYEQITVPVIFHVLDRQENIDRNQSIPEKRINQILAKINGVFMRELNSSPNGANTSVNFKLAEYDPNGRKISGINVHKVDEKIENPVEYLKANELIWPHEKYLNVWFVTDVDTQVNLPKTQIEGSENAPEGISLDIINNVDLSTREVEPLDIGIFIKLQDAAALQSENAEVVTLFGRYFGLMNNYGTSPGRANDYCEDTFDYYWYKWSKSNQTLRKWAFIKRYFYSINIMNDPNKGAYLEITQDQMLRIRWYVENCPDRWMWKSDFAFTGVD